MPIVGEVIFFFDFGIVGPVDGLWLFILFHSPSPLHLLSKSADERDFFVRRIWLLTGKNLVLFLAEYFLVSRAVLLVLLFKKFRLPKAMIRNGCSFAKKCSHHIMKLNSPQQILLHLLGLFLYDLPFLECYPRVVNFEVFFSRFLA